MGETLFINTDIKLEIKTGLEQVNQHLRRAERENAFGTFQYFANLNI